MGDVTATSTHSTPAPQPELATDLSVVAVVLTYNSASDIEACLASLLASSFEGLGIVVVDNDSCDGSADLVAQKFPSVALIRSGENRGFGAGCNLGIRAALDRSAAAVFLVNPDSYVEVDTVAQLAAFMDAHPRAAASGPKTLSTTPMSGGENRLLYAGSFRRWLPMRQRIPGIGQADRGEPAQPLAVDFIWGHGMWIRSSVLRDVGCFDEAFFMYYEDLDLSRRITAAGFELWCVPAAVMWHDAPDGARAGSSDAWRWQYKAAAQRVFHRKYYGLLQGAALGLMMASVESAQLLLSGRWRAFLHHASAHVRLPSARAQ
ncbi:MAG: GT2 family glycosyltransferase [Bacteroidia bacterium]|jgi:GT2 family glycosyltransferase